MILDQSELHWWCVKSTPSPTIAAAASNQDVRRRGLSWAWAEGVQAVEGVLAAVAWRGERVAALRVPAVDVAAVPDAAFRALCLLRLLNMVNTCTNVRSNAQILVGKERHWTFPAKYTDKTHVVCFIRECCQTCEDRFLPVLYNIPL